MPRKALTKSQLIKKLDKIFSKYIRLRDALITTGTKTHALCITCKRRFPIKDMHAGHWRKRGRHATRYDEGNVHAQCTSCNTYRDGMEEEHRRAIIERHGEGADDRLYELSNTVKKYTVGELRELVEYHEEEYKFVEENN